MQKWNGSLLRKFDDTIDGNASVGTTVVVRKTVDNTLAVIYDVDDVNSVQKNNPFVTDDFGRYSFYAPNGKYTIEFGDGSDSIDIGLYDNVVGNDAIYTHNFNNISDLKLGLDSAGQIINLNLLIGVKVFWRGYYAESDGGSNWGIVKSGAHTEDGGSIFSLGANLYVEANLKGSVSGLKFGVKKDRDFDNTAILNTLISYIVKDDLPDYFGNLANGVSKRGHKITLSHGFYGVKGTILIPSGIDFDLKRAVLVGNLSVKPIYTNANVMFKSAFINGAGNVESNLAQPNEVGRCVNSQIHNGSIIECYTAFELKNFNENGSLRDITFFDCAINVKSTRGFYSTYRNLFARHQNADITAATEAGFWFFSSTNAIEVYNVNVVGRKTGMLINGAAGEGTRAMTVRKCGFEECEVGLQTLFSLQPLSIVDNYFEYCSVTGLDLSNASAQFVEVKSNWFGSCGTGIRAVSSESLDIASTNTFISCPTKVSWGSDIESKGSLGIPAVSQIESLDNRTALPAGYSVGKGVSVDYPVFIYNNATGLPYVKHNYTSGLIDLPYTGNPGITPNSIPFCELAFAVPSAGAVDIYIRTQIPYSKFIAMVFILEITDSINTFKIQGRILGLDVFLDGGDQTHPVSVIDSSGFSRIVVTGFSGAGSATVTGVIRHM